VKVKDLIEKLEKFEPELDVRFEGETLDCFYGWSFNNIELKRDGRNNIDYLLLS
jgi:hypothetical protein